MLKILEKKFKIQRTIYLQSSIGKGEVKGFIQKPNIKAEIKRNPYVCVGQFLIPISNRISKKSEDRRILQNSFANQYKKLIAFFYGKFLLIEN